MFRACGQAVTPGRIFQPKAMWFDWSIWSSRWLVNRSIRTNRLLGGWSIMYWPNSNASDVICDQAAGLNAAAGNRSKGSRFAGRLRTRRQKPCFFISTNRDGIGLRYDQLD
jgi:hypothetical protein